MSKNFKKISKDQASKVAGGAGDQTSSKGCIVVSEHQKENGVVVEYECQNCKQRWKTEYKGEFMTMRGYPSTVCTKCNKKYWGGEEIKI
ncbi:MAG: hypothetical protein FWC41_12365 [Firmicutes bacterium]|nr:hypothetical protein [Bacillota bacterium]